MKIKKLLTALPLVAVFASCSARIDVYKDIFKDARGLDDEIKEIALTEMYSYEFSGSRTIKTFRGELELSSNTENISASFAMVEEAGVYNYYATYHAGLEDIIDISYDPLGDSYSWVKCPDSSLDPRETFFKFRSAVFSWKGHVLSGDFDTVPYAYDTNLLDAVSRRSKILYDKKASEPNFTAQMISGPASYKDGKITYHVSSFTATYMDYRLKTYACTYSIKINSVGYAIQFEVSGEFLYNGEH